VKAILQTGYGPPEGSLHLQEVEKPSPKEHQVLVKVVAASANALDWRPFAMGPILPRLFGGGLSKPKDPKVGVDAAGVVEAVGSEVAEFKPGDEVFGGCAGSFAEYALARDTKVVHKPANISFEAAAAVPVAALTALQGLRDHGHIQAGEKVLIHGASGGVGIYAVQIAKAFGAEVTGVCSARNLEMVRSLGADHVLDYRREDFAKSGQKYDLILAVNGYRSVLTYRRALSANGRYVMAGGKVGQILEGMVLAPLIGRIGTKKMGFMGLAQLKKEDLLILKQMLEAGQIAPVIDRYYSLNEVAGAIRYMLEEHARGKVVIQIQATLPDRRRKQ
jgi:NADPH:quinone reductase-like Zn-dependent oxidoreductase